MVNRNDFKEFDFAFELEEHELLYVARLHVDSMDEELAMFFLESVSPNQLEELSIAKFPINTSPSLFDFLNLRQQKLQCLQILDIRNNLQLLAALFESMSPIPLADYTSQLFVCSPPNTKEERGQQLVRLIFDKDVDTLRKTLNPPFGRGTQHLRLICHGAQLIDNFKIDDDFLGLRGIRVIDIQPRLVIHNDSESWRATLDIAPYVRGRLDLPLPRPYEKVPNAKAIVERFATTRSNRNPLRGYPSRILLAGQAEWSTWQDDTGLGTYSSNDVEVW